MRRFSVSLSTTVVVFSGTLTDKILLQKSDAICMKNFATHDYHHTLSLFQCRFIATTRKKSVANQSIKVKVAKQF